MSFSNWLNQEILDEVFGAEAMPSWSNWFVGLSTTTPNSSGLNFTEPPAGSGYYRVSVTNDKTEWSTAALVNGISGHVDNRQTIQFGESTGGWGTVTHFGIFVEVTGANMVDWGVLTTPQAIAGSNTPSFASGAIDIYIN